MRISLALALTMAVSAAEAFAPSSSSSSFSRISTTRTTTTELAFGIPSFFTPDNNDGDEKDTKKSEQDEKKIGWSGLFQLITAGAGSPFLGDFEGVDEETGNFMFSLEANNLVDEDGNSKQTSMPYFESGWVDPEDEKKAAEGFKFPWQK